MNIDKLVNEVIPPADYSHRNGFNNIPIISKTINYLTRTISYLAKTNNSQELITLPSSLYLDRKNRNPVLILFRYNFVPLI